MRPLMIAAVVGLLGLAAGSLDNLRAHSPLTPQGTPGGGRSNGTPAAEGEGKTITPDLAKIADTGAWRLLTGSASTTEQGGKRLVRLRSGKDIGGNLDAVGMALVAGLEFDEGVIDVDLRGKNVLQQSFLGICFHVKETGAFEAVYFRPFNFRADQELSRAHGVQYISMPDHSWKRLRAEHPGTYENAVKPAPDPAGWFHARIEVTAGKVRVWVNDAREPSLTVDRLTRRDKGGIGLWTAVSDGEFANLKITPAAKR